MSTEYPYRFDSQFDKYIGQVMRVFSGFQVYYDDNTLRPVPVRYGSMSRIVASVLNKRDSLHNQALPTMAVNLSSIEPAPDNKRSHHHSDAVTYRDRNGAQKSSERIIGPAFKLNLDVSIYASSVTQMFEILEQILLVFNPRVAFQVDNDAFNSDYITELELVGINDDINTPLGVDNRTVMMTLQFQCPVRLRYPMDFDAPLIETIKARIFDESASEAPIEDFVIGGEVS